MPALTGGCGRGKAEQIDFIIKKGGVEVGTDTVWVEEEGGSVVYSSATRRPYRAFDITIYRKITFSSDHERFLGYYSNRRVRGAQYRTYLYRKGDVFSYLRDDLQSFEFLEGLFLEKDFTPLEPDSACEMQALLDRLLASGKAELRVRTAVPIDRMSMRETFISRAGEGRANIRTSGAGEVRLKFDAHGRLEEAVSEADGTVLARGAAPGMESRPYAPSGRLQSKEVRIPTADRLELAGSLYIPVGKRPYRAVVLAGDYGPQDRTGAGFLSQVAERLAEEGLAVLVCDKRGIPPSEGHYGTYTLESAVSDLDSQVDFLVLNGDMDIDHIAVVGYGEGGVIASTVAARNPYVSALVLMATPCVRVFPDLVLTQEEEVVRRGTRQEGELAAERVRLENLVDIVGRDPARNIMIEGHRQFLEWMRSYMKHDMRSTLTSLDIPVLIVQGGEDGVVGVAQAREISSALEARGRSEQRLVVFEKLGHEFGDFSDETSAKPFRAHPEVKKEVLDTVVRWLKEKLGAK